MLLRGSSALAQRMGVSRLAVGLTVVAFGTSMPELIVSMDAAFAGAGDIALGNVVGSNVANVGLILGVSALLHPLEVHSKVIRLDVPLMVGVSVALLAVYADGVASRTDAAFLLTGVVAYTVFTFWQARRETEEARQEFASAAPAPRLGVGAATVGVVVGLVLLALGGRLLVRSAMTLASSLGVSEAVIGLTIVAVGTSLPEIAASVIAALRGHGDIAIGNVVGSNIFNVLGVLGLTSLARPLEMGAIRAFDLGVMVAVSVLLAVLLWWRTRLARAEGALLLTTFVGYTVWLLRG